MSLILFLFGTAAGSFLDVIVSRYNPDEFVLSHHVIGGRSRCPHCKKTLRWFELVPLISFFVQGGRCRSCDAKIGLECPVVETICGLIFVFVPHSIKGFSLAPFFLLFLNSLWILVFLTLLLITLIDLRLTIIPDEANMFLLILGVGIVTLSSSGLGTSPLLGSYAALFGLENDAWLNHILAAFVGGGFFAFLVAITRGRGMGVGDIKFGTALGFVFGWPEILLIMVLAFVAGALFGLLAMLRGKKTMKSAIPFGPFLSVAATAVFFFAYPIFQAYFSLFLAA